ncbi:hypothetical protein GCM10027299_45990 [Larkinella ripae]
MLWLACQNEASEFGIEPGGNTYNDEASPVRKLLCGTANCLDPNSVEHYQYNKDGKLTRIDYQYRTSSGKLETFSYVEQIYNKHGNRVGKIRYGKYGTSSDWVAQEESEYAYENGFLKVERNYYNQRNPDQRVLTGSVEYDFKDGLKRGQQWFDANHHLSYRVAYEYKNEVLTRETWYSNDDKVMRYLTHSFAGSRRQISERMPNHDELIALVEKTYDKKGRLLTEETKVNNPLLCVMVPGMVRYDY